MQLKDYANDLGVDLSAHCCSVCSVTGELERLVTYLMIGFVPHGATAGCGSYQYRKPCRFIMYKVGCLLNGNICVLITRSAIQSVPQLPRTYLTRTDKELTRSPTNRDEVVGLDSCSYCRKNCISLQRNEERRSLQRDAYSDTFFL